MTKVFLIRHAEAEGNIYRRAHGHYNGLITNNGNLQIEELSKRFAKESIVAVYSSDLSRTCTTAKSISEPKNLQIQTTNMLREVNMGTWEDLSWGDIQYNYPEMYNNFTYDPDKWNIEGGENYGDIKDRMYNFICEKASEHDGKAIAMFSHGFVIRALISKLENVPSERTREVPYCDNTAVALLNYENGDLSIEFHGDSSHLSSEISTLSRQSWWKKDHEHNSQNLRFKRLSEITDEELAQISHDDQSDSIDTLDEQYVAFHSDTPVGILGLDKKRDMDKSVGWLEYLHVIPSCQRMSYGTQLLGLAISELRKLRRAKMRIEAPTHNTAVEFLSKYGFYTLETNNGVCLMEKDIKNW